MEASTSPNATYTVALTPSITQSNRYSNSDATDTAIRDDIVNNQPLPRDDLDEIATLDGSEPTLSRIHHWARQWIVFRWRMAQSVFAKPLPFLTAQFDIKQGDLLVTLPVILILTIVTAIECADYNVGSTGTPPALALLVVFSLSVRNNFLLLFATGISFERVLFYHRLFGHVVVVLAALHGLAYVLRYYNDPNSGHGDPNLGHDDQLDSGRALTGVILFALMVLVVVLSLQFIRRKFFEFFVRVHWLLFVLIIVFAVIHGAGIALIGFGLWAIDLLFRLFYRRQVYTYGSFKKPRNAHVSPEHTMMGVIARKQVRVCCLPGGITRIQFPRVHQETSQSFDYKAGQYIFLCIPQVSMMEWHPFTISSSPHEPLVTLHIKQLGDWTKRVHVAAAAATESSAATLTEPGSSPAPFDLLVDGPYGSVAIDIESCTTYSHFVLFSGGIGITPMQSVVNELYYKYQQRKNHQVIQRVHFVWAVRDRELINGMFDEHFVKERQKLSGMNFYLPDELMNNSSTSTRDGVFTSEIFLTQSQPDMENPMDRSLQHCMRYATRPAISQTLRCVAEDAKQSNKTRVAVLVCGPAAMIKQVINESIRLSKEMQVQFDVHNEYFEF